MVNVIIEEPAFTIRITGGIGAQGSKGDPGNGIASAVLNDDYTLTLNFTDGTSYTTEPIRGAKGEPGATGNGIASAVLNADYTLTLTFTDGTSYTTPSIRGEKGDDGFSPVATVSKSGTVTTVTITDSTQTTSAEIHDGEQGEPGYSPTASVSKSGNVSTITITDKNGTTTAEVEDGEQGIPGVSPTVTVTDITGGHRVTITDADHPGGISFDVPNGSPGEGVPTGGTTGQILKKSSGTDYDTEWGEMPVASATQLGIVGINNTFGISINDSGKLYISPAVDTYLQSGSSSYNAITPYYQHKSVFFGLSKVAGADLANKTVTVGTYPEASKSAIQNLIGGAISVTGTTPTINALPGLRYICGEVSTLTVNLPASGCVDIQFESGSTATVLTVVPASGQTVKWANGFDPDTLEADTTYEINVADGLGVAASWTA